MAKELWIRKVPTQYGARTASGLYLYNPDVPYGDLPLLRLVDGMIFNLPDGPSPYAKLRRRDDRDSQGSVQQDQVREA